MFSLKSELNGNRDSKHCNGYSLHSVEQAKCSGIYVAVVVRNAQCAHVVGGVIWCLVYDRELYTVNRNCTTCICYWMIRKCH